MAWRRVLKLLIAAPLVALLVHYGAEFLAVDACLDSGGIYDYAQDQCRKDVQALPYLPYLARHGMLVTGLLTLSLAGTVISYFGRRGRPH